MKSLRKIIWMIGLTLLVSAAGLVTVSGAEPIPETSPLAEEARASVLEDASLAVTVGASAEAPVDCFDVSETGAIALGLNSPGSGKTAEVYSAEGAYLYTVSFRAEGRFYVAWRGEWLALYLDEERVGMTVNAAGEIGEVFSVAEGVRLSETVLADTEKTVGERRYALSNDMGILNRLLLSYTRLSVTDSEGVSVMLYDVNRQQLLKYGISFAVVVVAVVYAVIRWRRKKKPAEEGGKEEKTTEESERPDEASEEERETRNP